MTKTISSYICGLCLALLIVAPAINYTIPMMVNGFLWVFLVIAFGMLGFLLWQTRLNIFLKILSAYLFIACFFSQAPYLSFNANILCVLALYLFLVCKMLDFSIITKFIESAFWFEVVLVCMQLLGKDVLINFDRPEQVFLGTCMQYMRMSSVFVCMAPFLLLKSKWYLVPITVLCVLSHSSTFAMSLIAGCTVYIWLTYKKFKPLIIAGSICCILGYIAYDLDSWRGAIIASNGGRVITWVAIVKTWMFDLAKCQPGSIWKMNGPFNLGWFLFGHGMDTFLPLFPIYKHDANPFPQAHCDWLQICWETGIVGFGLVSAYMISLIKKLMNNENYVLVAGLVIIGVDMFLAFPMRMTQSMFLIVAFLALCERKKYESF